MDTIDVALPDDLRSFVVTQAATRGYGGASEFICSLVARAKQGQDRIESLLIEGLDSGDPILLDHDQWQSMRDAARARLQQ